MGVSEGLSQNYGDDPYDGNLDALEPGCFYFDPEEERVVKVLRPDERSHKFYRTLGFICLDITTDEEFYVLEMELPSEGWRKLSDMEVIAWSAR